MVTIAPANGAGCNEAVCASIVSKCTLLRSCDCQITEDGCPCCKKCFACLEFLQADCCACVGLCPVQNVTVSVVQVWSLTQFYSVDFSQSRIGVNKCVFNKRTIEVCVCGV